MCLSTGEGVPDQVHTAPPPEEQTHPPPGDTHYSGPGTPPRTRYTPRSTPPQDQIHPPPRTRYTPHLRTRYTPQDQVHPPDQVHPLWDQIHPPGTRYTPQTRYTPLRDQVHPPGPGAPPGPGTSSLGPGTPPGTRYIPQTRYTPLRDQVHPPGPGTPPRTRYTPRDQVHPPEPGTPPLQSMLGDMVNARAVRILLECNLVHTKRLCLLRRRLYFGVLSRHTIICENTFLVVYLFISISAFDKMSHLSFEKDDDSNGHIDFITAASVRCDQCQTC